MRAPRRQSPLKLILNMSSFWMETVAALAVFHLVGAHGGVGPATWAADSLVCSLPLPSGSSRRSISDGR